jgi:hypothetical protein
MNRPDDLELAREQGWYRIPVKKAGRGASFEYIAFYFTAGFGQKKWAIHYYARNLGHELLTRRELLPHEPDHPRASDLYYKLQLGPIQQCVSPIPSLRWRRITFIYTTWDRFQAAEEINDLYAEGGEFVDRLYHALRESGFGPERCYPIRESGVEYIAELAVPCRTGVVVMETAGAGSQSGIPEAIQLHPEMVTVDPEDLLSSVRMEVARRGGVMPKPAGTGCC